MTRLFKLVPILSDGSTEEPVKYVGVYVRRWGKVVEPEVAFAETEMSLRESKQPMKEQEYGYA